MPLTRMSDGALGVEAFGNVSNDNGEVAAEVRALRSEISMLRKERREDAKRAEQQRDAQTNAAVETVKGVEALRMGQKVEGMRRKAA
ncbi:hypothetical protein [Roseomonas sp. WA12]